MFFMPKMILLFQLHSDRMVEALQKAGNTNVPYTRYDDAPDSLWRYMVKAMLVMN